MRQFVLVLAVWLVASAGCVASEGAPNAGTSMDTTPRFDDTSGAIQVLVTDDELQPVPNATVGLIPGSGAPSATIPPLSTSASGSAVFSNVPPGTYGVQAVALGYESATKSVDARAGEVTDIQLILPRLPSDDPYYETISKTGTVRSILWRVGPSCDTVVQPPIGTCLGFQSSDVTFYRVLAEDWATIVDEATWVPNTAASHQRAYVFATFPNVTDFSGVPDFKSPGHFEAAGRNPVALRIERAEIRERGFPEENHYGKGPRGDDCGTRCGTRFRAVNDFEDLGVPGVIGVSFMWEQVMTVYNTEFHKEVAPADFSALPDS